MDKLVIHGQRPLKGRVQINGAKNAVLAIVAAACLADDVCIIENIPKSADIDNTLAVIDGDLEWINGLGQNTLLAEENDVIDL